MSECTHEWSKGKLNYPYCEIDRLNKEINRLRQYEDAITSAIDGTLLVWNLMSTNHTVIKNDYWQNHLEEIDRLKAELEFEQFSAKHSEEVVKERIAEVKDLERQLAEARAEVERLKEVQGICEVCEVEAIKHADKARKQSARECLKWMIQNRCISETQANNFCCNFELQEGEG